MVRTANANTRLLFAGIHNEAGASGSTPAKPAARSGQVSAHD
jgi:hypothetical protein